MKTPLGNDSETAVAEKLALLRQDVQRSTVKAAHTRAHYLVQVKNICKNGTPLQAVSVGPFDRLNGWISTLVQFHPKKERYAMFSAIAAVVLMLSLMFGGAGAVFAAQDSLPQDFLYPVKNISEDVQLNLTVAPQKELDLALAFSQRRVDEILACLEAGEPVPEPVAARLQFQLELALKTAAGLGDPQMGPALEAIQVQLQRQAQRMAAVQTRPGALDHPILQRVQTMLQLQLGVVSDALQDPAAFRARMQAGTLITTPPGPGEQNRTPEPVMDGAGPGPQNQGAVTQPVDGYGPGPGPQNQGAVTQPVDGYGPGPGPQNGAPTAQPTPGAGSGGDHQGTPGCTDCGLQPNNGANGQNSNSQGGTQTGGNGDSGRGNGKP